MKQFLSLLGLLSLTSGFSAYGMPPVSAVSAGFSEAPSMTSFDADSSDVSGQSSYRLSGVWEVIEDFNDSPINLGNSIEKRREEVRNDLIYVRFTKDQKMKVLTVSQNREPGDDPISQSTYKIANQTRGQLSLGDSRIRGEFDAISDLRVRHFTYAVSENDSDLLDLVEVSRSTGKPLQKVLLRQVDSKAWGTEAIRALGKLESIGALGKQTVSSPASPAPESSLRTQASDSASESTVVKASSSQPDSLKKNVEETTESQRKWYDPRGWDWGKIAKTTIKVAKFAAELLSIVKEIAA